MTTSINWPASLPQTFLLGMDYRPADDRIQSQPELGPPMIRPRQALSIVEVDVPQFWTGAQLATFTTFWVTTLVRGSLTFNWVDPTTGVSAEMSFRARPSVRPYASDAAASKRGWSVTLALRIHT